MAGGMNSSGQNHFQYVRVISFKRVITPVIIISGVIISYLTDFTIIYLSYPKIAPVPVIPIGSFS
jgi:hypothetical protein